MPTYEYHCDKCDENFDKILPLARYDEPQECPTCNVGPAKKLLSMGAGFILKGDGWVGKNNRVAGQMREKNAALGKKQEERKHDATVRLVPNVEGQRVDSWSEASKLARSKGKDTTGYDSFARKTGK